MDIFSQKCLSICYQITQSYLNVPLQFINGLDFMYLRSLVRPGKFRVQSLRCHTQGRGVVLSRVQWRESRCHSPREVEIFSRRNTSKWLNQEMETGQEEPESKTLTNLDFLTQVPNRQKGLYQNNKRYLHNKGNISRVKRWPTEWKACMW